MSLTPVSKEALNRTAPAEQGGLGGNPDTEVSVGPAALVPPLPRRFLKRLHA